MEDVEFMVRKLNTIRIGGMNMVVMKARERSNEVRNVGQKRDVRDARTVPKVGMESVRDQRRYSEVLNVGIKKDNKMMENGNKKIEM